MNTQTKPLPPPPKKAGSTPPPAGGGAAPATNGERFKVTTGVEGGAERIVIYGPGGIGKTTLASLAPNPVVLDLENGTRRVNVARTQILTFADLRDFLRSPKVESYETIVIDSVTKAEELVVSYVLQTVMNEKGKAVENIEAYGFGKGYQYVYDAFLLLLQDLDAQVRAGRNVILIAHDCTADVPNPAGDDYIRYAPRLQSPKSGKASIRHRVKEWADFVLFLGYDVNAEDGKGTGGGTRTIYPNEMPDHIAKSRMSSLSGQIPFRSDADDEVWRHIFGTEGGAA